MRGTSRDGKTIKVSGQITDPRTGQTEYRVDACWWSRQMLTLVENSRWVVADSQKEAAESLYGPIKWEEV